MPFPSPGGPPNPGIEPPSLASPALAGGFFTNEPPRKPENLRYPSFSQRLLWQNVGWRMGWNKRCLSSVSFKHCRKSQGRTDKRSPVRTNAHDELQRHGNFPVRRKLRQPDYRHERRLLSERHGGCHQQRRYNFELDFAFHQHFPCSHRHGLGRFDKKIRCLSSSRIRHRKRPCVFYRKS